MNGHHGSNGGMHIGVVAQDPMHVQYEHHGLHHIDNENGMMDDHPDNGMTEDVETDIPSHPGNSSDNRGEVVDRGIENGDQLTLSFQGQVYVFDRVSPEKVTLIAYIGAQKKKIV